MTTNRIFDYSKLKGRIIEKYDSLSAFAEKMGVSTATISIKLTTGQAFNALTIIDWAYALDIDVNDYGIYFFTLKVMNT